jgi:CRISPR/Cas system-associated exonuclease Cas4 (RecB family)
MIAFADPPPVDTAPVIQPGRTIEELTSTVSASRLSTWLQCQLKFHLRYVAGISKPPTAALHVGKAIHAVLQQWSLARWRGAPLDGDAISAVFDAVWATQEGTAVVWEEEEETVAKASALATVQTYLRDTPIPVDEKPEGVEVSVEMDLASHGLPVLVGVLDLVRAGGRIVDFKTTARTPDPAMVRHTTEVQTTGYALLYGANRADPLQNRPGGWFTHLGNLCPSKRPPRWTKNCNLLANGSGAKWTSPSCAGNTN